MLVAAAHVRGSGGAGAGLQPLPSAGRQAARRRAPRAGGSSRRSHPRRAGRRREPPDDEEQRLRVGARTHSEGRALGHAARARWRARAENRRRARARASPVPACRRRHSPRDGRRGRRRAAAVGARRRSRRSRHRPVCRLPLHGARARVDALPRRAVPTLRARGRPLLARSHRRPRRPTSGSTPSSRARIWRISTRRAPSTSRSTAIPRPPSASPQDAPGRERLPSPSSRRGRVGSCGKASPAPCLPQAETPTPG